MNLQICNHCRHSVVTPVYFWRLLEDKFYFCHGCCWDGPSHFSTFGICKRFSFGKFSSDTQTLYYLKSHNATPKSWAKTQTENVPKSPTEEQSLSSPSNSKHTFSYRRSHLVELRLVITNFSKLIAVLKLYSGFQIDKGTKIDKNTHFKCNTYFVSW